MTHATRDTTTTLECFQLQDFHLLWCSFSLLRLTFYCCFWLSHYPICLHKWFRLFPFRSPLHRKSLLLSLPPATKMFQFAGFARSGLLIPPVVSGLPHSDTSGSMLASSSPEFFVGSHVLLRLCVPRYPPSALSHLTTSLEISFLSLIFEFVTLTFFSLTMQFSRFSLNFRAQQFH